MTNLKMTCLSLTWYVRCASNYNTRRSRHNMRYSLTVGGNQLSTQWNIYVSRDTIDTCCANCRWNARVYAAVAVCNCSLTRSLPPGWLSSTNMQPRIVRNIANRSGIFNVTVMTAHGRSKTTICHLDHETRAHIVINMNTANPLLKFKTY